MKAIILIQEKYRKGNVVNKNQIKKMIDENLEKITTELKERTKYSDGTEEMIISIRY